MQQGWVSIHRKLQDNTMWLSEPFTRGQAWVDMILLANYKDGFIRVRGVRVEVKRGQLGWSENELGNRWKWSRGKVRRFLEELEKNELKIVQQKSKVKSLISILNYNKYQDNGTTDSTTDGHQTVQQTDTNNKVNKDNKRNKKDIYTSSDLKMVEGELAELTPEQRERWDSFQKWYTEQKFTKVTKIENQLTPKELMSLLYKYEFTSAEICFKMGEIDNFKNCHTKYTSVYATIRNWIIREKKQSA